MRKHLILFLPILLACAANSQSADAGCGAARKVLSPADTTIYDTTQVTTRPTVLSGPSLEYPERARQQRITGRVSLALVVNADGRVQEGSIRVLESPDRLLERPSINYARAAVFQPACLDGRAVRVRLRVPIDFKIFP